jgi:hypothetical protein
LDYDFTTKKEKVEIPNLKSQIPNNCQIQMTKMISFGILNIGIYLACLREAPPAKALCGGQALRRRQGFGAYPEGPGFNFFSESRRNRR